MAKKSFLGFKQVVKATYEAAVANKSVAGYIWFVRADKDSTDGGDIYFGSRHYGHFSASELSSLETKLTELITANTTSINEVKDAIAALVVNDAAVAGQYVSAVSQKDGKITVTRAALPASKVDGVVAADKFLTLGSDKLIGADVTMSYDSGAKKIYLYGKDKKTPVSTIDATDFIKDGMLDSASFNEESHILTLTFNKESGEEAIDVDLSKLVDTYKAGTGLVLATDGTFSLDTATQASLAKADSAIQSVSGDADTFAVVGAKDASNAVKVSNKVQKVSTASSTAKGLAEASDVKAELDKKVDVEEGKRLMTVAEGTKLSGIAEGAQVNVIEGVEGGNAIAVSAVSSKKQTVSLKIDTTTPGNVSLTQGANGLKASVTIPAAKVDSIASSGKTINVTNSGAAWNVDVNKAVAPETLGAHNIFLENGADGALYGVMYYDGDDVE